MKPPQSLIASLTKRFQDTSGLLEIDNLTLLNIANRGSCRDFTDTKVEDNLVQTLCAVSLASPTKSDLQQRDIIIVDDKEQRQRISAIFSEVRLIREAPLLLVFCANNRRLRQISKWREIPFENDHLDAFFNASVDAGIALASFVIAAESEGLGCCPISEIRNHVQQVTEILELPDYVFPVAGLAVGWPVEPPLISMRLPLAATVHRNSFSEERLEMLVDGYDLQRSKIQPSQNQRNIDRFGLSEKYGWSEDKARQYANPQRSDFGEFIRRKGFNLD